MRTHRIVCRFLGHRISDPIDLGNGLAMVVCKRCGLALDA